MKIYDCLRHSNPSNYYTSHILSFLCRNRLTKSWDINHGRVYWRRVGTQSTIEIHGSNWRIKENGNGIYVKKRMLRCDTFWRMSVAIINYWLNCSAKSSIISWTISDSFFYSADEVFSMNNQRIEFDNKEFMMSVLRHE